MNYQTFEKEYGKDLLALDPDETQRLMERIDRWKGLVRIFIHPMYEKWKGNEPRYTNDLGHIKLIQIERVLSSLVTMPETKTPPLIVMEETKHVPKLQKWLAAKTPDAQEVFFIKTMPDDSTPHLPITTWTKTEKWARLVRRLTRLGVKKILMVGVYFEVSLSEKDWTNKGPSVNRCVGIAMSHLSRDKAGPFELRLSALIDCPLARGMFIEFMRNT